MNQYKVTLKEDKTEYYTDSLQKLFDHMSNDHCLTLVESEMFEIANVVKDEFDLVSRQSVIDAIEEYVEKCKPIHIDPTFLLTLIKNLK